MVQKPGRAWRRQQLNRLNLLHFLGTKNTENALTKVRNVGFIVYGHHITLRLIGARQRNRVQPMVRLYQNCIHLIELLSSKHESGQIRVNDLTAWLPAEAAYRRPTPAAAAFDSQRHHPRYGHSSSFAHKPAFTGL